MLRPSLCSEVDGLNDAQTSELGRLSTGKGGLPLWGWRQNRNHTPPQPWTTDKKKPPPKAGVPKTLLGSVTLFPPREAFFLTKTIWLPISRNQRSLGSACELTLILCRSEGQAQLLISRGDQIEASRISLRYFLFCILRSDVMQITDCGYENN